MGRLNFKNRWVIVTGASSGLGRAIARRMAEKEQANLIITARREERLAALKAEIEMSTPSKIHIIPADLSRSGTPTRLFQKSTELEDIYALINNAGMTFYGQTRPSDMDRFDTVMQVNFSAIMHLTLLFLSYFEERGEGAILNITSLGGSIPMPYQTVYSASKHAAQSFTECLYQEYKRHKNIVISSFAPGGVQTEMLKKSGLDQKIEAKSPVNMKAPVAARKAVNGFKKKKYFLVPGFLNKLTLFMTRWVPRKWVTAVSEKIYLPPDRR